ncbi:MAG: helix-turn-helix transcriptional regulator [Solirubrobacterales bacterium]|nr:helix-turn-helix transcriptional regulator [Solirubrobacterales bacterium]
MFAHNRTRDGAIGREWQARGAAITRRDALTSAELRVARLVAEGLTDGEIAQALFITTKTAKAHLGPRIRKLEIGRRAVSGRADRPSRRQTPGTAQYWRGFLSPRG